LNKFQESQAIDTSQSSPIRQKSFSVGDQVEVSGFYKPHDKFRVELKFEYNLNQDTPESDFLVEAYMFIPQALGLTDNLLRSTDFFSDIRSYMRYAVQPMDLADLADFKNSVSPLARVREFLQNGKIVERTNQPANFFLHESKLITCIFKETVKVELNKIEAVVKAGKKNPEALEYSLDLMETLNKQVATVQKQFYTLSDLVKDNSFVSINDDEGFAGVCEFFYYEMNLFYVSIFEIINQVEFLGGKVKSFKEKIKADYVVFGEYAKAKKYIQLNEDSSDRNRERFIYREGKLKKFVSSILFLNRDLKSNKKTEELFFAIAAGMAMMFAVLMAVISAYYWPINSVPWMLFVVFVYVIRDRGKAWMQEKFRSLAPVYMAHRTQKLVEENVGLVGSLKEWLVFRNYEQVPLDIMEVRTSNREMVGAFKKSEDILFYKKQIKLNNQFIYTNHQRVNKVVNILRFNMKRFCAYMDDPSKVLKVVDENGSVNPILGRKVYHLNMVFKITSNFGKENAESEKLNLKIVISRDGIERIESPQGHQMAKLFELTWFAGQV
jgi:hypothetical protein